MNFLAYIVVDLTVAQGAIWRQCLAVVFIFIVYPLHKWSVFTQVTSLHVGLLKQKAIFA